MHPYVICNINKADIYALAKRYQLDTIKSLPAQPCLASRIETGIPVNETVLHFIDNAERNARRHCNDSHTLRCRITAAGVYLEVDNALSDHSKSLMKNVLFELCEETGFQFRGIRPYRQGSAFINAGA